MEKQLANSSTWKWLDGSMEFLMTPLYKWPLPWRHVYLCTYPLAFVLRWASVVALLMLTIVWYVSTTTRHCFTNVWNGKRCELD